MSLGPFVKHENEITDTEATTASTSNDNDQIQGSSRKLGEVLAEIPEEVLSEIFSWCCPTFNDRFSAPPMSALVLSHVCQRWRKNASATPRLWTYTSLGAPRHNCESATQLMLLWITNSKTCPLVIDIDFSQFAAFKTPDAILPTVLELTELAAELKPALSPDDMPLTVTAASSVSIKFPYVSEEYYWTNDDLLPEHVARGSLQLRVATKPCILLGMDGHKNFGPYLVHLDLRDDQGTICLTMEEALGVMRMYKNLRHLTFRLGDVGDGQEEYTLPHLKTLGLSWCDEADPAAVFNSLCAPNLQNLELDGLLPQVNLIEGIVWDPLRHFLQRSMPPLRALDLYKIRCNDIDLLGCLARCPGLERLWLEDCSIDEHLVDDFVERRHPLVEAAQLTLESLKTVGLVRCQIFNVQQFFQSLVVSGAIWRVTTLRGLYLSDCNFNEGVSETWHLLRSRFEDGAYESLA